MNEHKRKYATWLRTEVPLTSVRSWIDGPVREKWGVKLAARTLHVARIGYDAELAKPFEKGEPSEKTMIRTEKVPGAWCPAQHAFAISQVLSWLAKERRDVQEQINKMQDIPVLMSQLLKSVR